MKVRFSVDRIEEGSYVLIGSENPAHVVIWPIDAMPEILSEGDIITLNVEVDRIGRIEEERKLKELIESLLAHS